MIQVTLKIRKLYVLIGLFLIVSIFVSLIVLAALIRQHPPSNSGSAAGGGSNSGNVTSTPLISRNVPAFSSSNSSTPASYGNDGSYDDLWRSILTPAWLAYDLSSVPTTERTSILVVWYNESFNYDHTLINSYSYNMPEDYTIEVNPAAGGGNPPPSGWVTKITVTGNHYHSRQHILSMAGDNWLRIHVTAIDGAAENNDANIKMDVFDSSTATADDWIFFGDSITALTMAQYTTGGVKFFAQLINDKVPVAFPIEEDGGTGYVQSNIGAQYMQTWLSFFPGKYVVLSYGTNDANGCVSPASFYNNYVVMLQAILKAGKIPVIPHIPWGRTPNIQQCGPQINAQIDALYKSFPQVVKGPDLWAYFQQHQNLISNDGIHPTSAGTGQYRLLWANTMLAEVFHT
ncbi:MAG TPA: SGNH/GDSL hydrolase family protein [Ktedonobacteraceae bacterium]|nr:SGNH/GDSL hydrolase family protein [Ktedonobacteraceae bacterium]